MTQTTTDASTTSTTRTSDTPAAACAPDAPGAASTPQRWQIGDRVRLDPVLWGAKGIPGTVYTITHVPTRKNEVNYVASPIDGLPGARGFRGPAESFLPEGAPVATAILDDLPSFVTGQLVTITVENRPRLVTVLRTSRDGRTFSAVEPGGRNGNYWTRINVRHATPVTPDEVFTPKALTLLH